MNRIVQKYIVSEELIPVGGKVLVALSGGADSVALLRMLLDMGYECEAAHCNFHLRGEESDRDESFVRDLCLKWQIPLHVTHFDTVGYASNGKISIEMAARELRYNWFEELRNSIGADVVAVAHHRDDTVETVLLNLIRGTGIDGLRGIRPRNGRIVRPLLCIGRKDIQDYLASLGQAYVTDSTNLEDEYTRNKIRLNILPLMESINPSALQSIAATASRLDDAALIYDRVIEEGKRRVKDEKGISIPALLKEPSPKSLLFELLYPLGFNSSQIDQIFDSLSGQSGRRFYAVRWCVLKDRDYLLLHLLSDESTENTHIELPLSGEVTCGETSKKIKVERTLCSPEFEIPRGKKTACLDIAKIALPLTLRKWKAGDRFVPFGMKGMKNVSDYLTDRKLTLFEKEQVYVVCSGENIVWVVGERSDNRFRIDDLTKEVVLLELIEA